MVQIVFLKVVTHEIAARGGALRCTAASGERKNNTDQIV
jgi:hypothetical protein